MLSEFEGIIDSNGLRCFRQRTHLRAVGGETLAAQQAVPFWAVMETAAACEVLREMLQGSRDRALKLLEETAHSIGSLPNH